MAKTANVNIRMDAELKRQLEALYAELGLNLTTAFNIFARQSLQYRGLPFEVRLKTPNAETVAAIAEGDAIIKSGKSRFKTADDMFKDLGI